jgi:cell division protein FtsQ
MGVAIKFTWPGRAGPDSRRTGEDKKARRKQKAGSQKAGSQRTRGRANHRATEALATRKGKSGQTKGATRRTVAQAEKEPRSFAWLNRILVLLAVGVVTFAGIQAWVKLQEISVERISVTGDMTHTRTTAVQEMVQPALSGGFLGANLQQVREQLEALPWIYEASVRRVWPNALEIHVVEQLPIARWGDAAFLNHEGEVFRPSNRDAWQTLPLLQGPEGQAGELMDYYQRLVDMLAPLGLGVSQLQMDGRGGVEAVLSGGQQLVIGGSDFLERMYRFAAVYRTELAGRMAEVERIDLRYERGVAVAFREPEAQTTTQSGKA